MAEIVDIQVKLNTAAAKAELAALEERVLLLQRQIAATGVGAVQGGYQKAKGKSHDSNNATAVAALAGAGAAVGRASTATAAAENAAVLATSAKAASEEMVAQTRLLGEQHVRAAGDDIFQKAQRTASKFEGLAAERKFSQSVIKQLTNRYGPGAADIFRPSLETAKAAGLSTEESFHAAHRDVHSRLNRNPAGIPASAKGPATIQWRPRPQTIGMTNYPMEWRRGEKDADSVAWGGKKKVKPRGLASRIAGSRFAKSAFRIAKAGWQGGKIGGGRALSALGKQAIVLAVLTELGKGSATRIADFQEGGYEKYIRGIHDRTVTTIQNAAADVNQSLLNLVTEGLALTGLMNAKDALSVEKTWANATKKYKDSLLDRRNLYLEKYIEATLGLPGQVVSADNRATIKQQFLARMNESQEAADKANAKFRGLGKQE